MIKVNDWRLLNNVQHLQNQSLDPVDGEEIRIHLPALNACIFCWDKINENRKARWYLPLDKSCCICEKCFDDFGIIFHWQLLDGWDINW